MGDPAWRPAELRLAVAFFVQHLDGSSEHPTVTFRFASLLDELEQATAEHGDVAVTHESGWTLTVFDGGRVAWENVEEDDEPRHLAGLSRDEVLMLLEQLAAGDLDAVESRPWVPGYGS